MAGDPFAKAKPGSPLNIPAEAYNTFIDTAVDFKQRRNRFGAGTSVPTGDFGLIPIKNSSGADRKQYEILQISGILFDPSTNLQTFKNQPVLTGVAPTSDGNERYVILQQPVKNGKIGAGLILGGTVVQLDIKDAGDDYADTISGDCTKLRTQPYGSAWIAYKESGTGTKWGYVIQGVQGSQLILAKTNGVFAKGGSQSVNVYRGTSPFGESYTSGDTVTAYNHFAQIGSDKWIICMRVQRNFRVIAAEC